MRPLSLSQIAGWCLARLVGDDSVVHAVGVDTRTLAPGSLYVALRGENHDGHDFCTQARAGGAQAADWVGHAVSFTLCQMRSISASPRPLTWPRSTSSSWMLASLSSWLRRRPQAHL